MILFTTVVVCLLLGAGAVAVLYWLNLLPGFERERSGESAKGDLSVSRGCFFSVVAFTAAWLVAWTVVLVLAFRFLRTPLQ
jgi:hypothetical protein